MVSTQERAGVLDNRAMKGTELQHRRKRLKNKRASNTMKKYRAFGHVHNKHPIRRKLHSNLMKYDRILQNDLQPPSHRSIKLRNVKDKEENMRLARKSYIQ